MSGFSIETLMLARRYADSLFADGLTASRSFEDADGNTHTITIVSGLITAWSIAGAGTPGEWQFNDNINSGQILSLGL